MSVTESDDAMADSTAKKASLEKSEAEVAERQKKLKDGRTEDQIERAIQELLAEVIAAG